MILVILKLLVVLIFLAMFIRRPSVVWGIGLLTVTTAVLLDTILGTFNREELLAELGFFFYVINGVILAGAATWFWGVIRPHLPGGTLLPATPGMAATSNAPVARVPATKSAPTAPTTSVSDPSPAPAPKLPPPFPADHVDNFEQAGYDRQMLFEEIRGRFSREDLNDLMFDLDVNEMDVATVGQTMDELVVRVMDAADQAGQASTVGLAVERILTPPPAQHLPRLSKLTPESPRTVVRHYVLAHYSTEQLQQLATSLDIDWEQLEGADKKAKTRAFLLYLYRRNRIGDLLDAMRAKANSKDAA